MQSFYLFQDATTTNIYTLSLHDALPIYKLATVLEEAREQLSVLRAEVDKLTSPPNNFGTVTDRKSTRLNSSHSQISYAVFCLKKKKKKHTTHAKHALNGPIGQANRDVTT